MTSLPAARLRRDRRTLVVLFGGIAVVTAAGWFVLLAVLAPRHLAVGGSVLGLGLGVTAYVLGVRHAFDADHIAAIDNTTRKLLAEGQRSVSVGFWFALGHSAMVGALSVLVAVGADLSTSLMSGDSSARQVLGAVGAAVSGLFLCGIGLLNLVAFRGIWRFRRRVSCGSADIGDAPDALAAGGLVARLLRARSVTRPWQMFLVGMLFGLGFDTASEIALLVLAGTGAASGLPWYAVLVLPLLFAAGMTLFDSLDGVFMSTAYRWAFLQPARKLYYNLTITGLSVAVALVIGAIELVGVLHEKAALSDPVTGWIASLQLDEVGYIVVGLFVLTWVLAVGYWRVARVEERWARRPGSGVPLGSGTGEESSGQRVDVRGRPRGSGG